MQLRPVINLKKKTKMSIILISYKYNNTQSIIDSLLCSVFSMTEKSAYTNNNMNILFMFCYKMYKMSCYKNFEISGNLNKVSYFY